MGLELVGQELLSIHASHSFVGIRHRSDGRRPPNVTQRPKGHAMTTPGLKTVIFPAKDLERTKAIFTALLGTAPTWTSPTT